jgi:hypothetical protein
MINKTGVELIADERKRQIEVEGWTAEHDAGEYHQRGEIAIAAACYALDYVATKYPENNSDTYIVAGRFWPWAAEWFKETPNDPIRQLVKAGALIAAEIDRLQRIKRKVDD